MSSLQTAVDTQQTRATKIDFTDDYIVVTLDDARILYVPLVWYSVLYKATDEQRHSYSFIGSVTSTQLILEDWPENDKDGYRYYYEKIE